MKYTSFGGRKIDIDVLYERIGYEFHDPSLLEQALTHSSFANEDLSSKHKDNERLEFLGDAVLELATSRFLYEKYPQKPEGELSKMRASIVCEPTLDLCARAFGLEDFVLLGKGEEKTGGRKRASVISDAMEAVIGAVYLDGGFDAAEEVIHKVILNDIESKQLYHDSKSKFQELIFAKKLGTPDYRLVKTEGPDHDKKYYVDLYVGDEKLSSGQGRSVKNAEKEAAFTALKKLDGRI